jgi:hypothetical protein
MPRNQTSLLLHPFFLLNLFLLIANDHWWKHAYPNALTGKISDFAGVFVQAVFLVACCRFKKIYAIIFTALFFAWWKSPLSETVIAGFGLARVVDYSDLAAISVLPIVFYLKPFQYGRLHYRYAIPFIAVIAWTAMVATTLPYRFGGFRYPEGYVLVDKRWLTKLTVDQFFQKLDSLHISWKQDSLVYLPVDANKMMMVVKNGPDSVYQMTPVEKLKDTLLFYEKDMGPHYIIPFLALEKDTITNIRFRIHDNGKRRVLELIEMNIPPDMATQYYLRHRVRKKYRELVRSFILE